MKEKGAKDFHKTQKLFVVWGIFKPGQRVCHPTLELAAGLLGASTFWVCYVTICPRTGPGGTAMPT